MCRPYLISLYTFFVLMFAFSSCKERVESEDLLQQAVAELEDNPEKAKELLEAIPNTQSMTEAQSMQYHLAYIEAKYRAYDDISEDSLILQTRNYYDQHNDIKRASYAHFYTAAYYYENKQYSKALESYLMANHKAIESKNSKLEGKSQNNIGYVFFIQGVPDSAIVHFNKALDLYYNNPTLKLPILGSLGAAYHAKKDNEATINYYQKGLELAKELDDKNKIAFFTHNIGAAYCDMDKLAEAKEYLYKALPITTNKADSVRLYLNLSQVYTKTNQLDSVSHYSALIEKNIANVTYNPTLKLIYTSLANYNAKIGNYTESIRYMELANEINEKIIEEQNTKQILEANAKFALALREEALAQQQLRVAAFGIFSFLILAIIGLFCSHKRQKLRHENELLHKQEKQLRLENDLLHQQSINLETTLNTYEDILKSRKEIFDDATFESIEKKKLDALFDKIRQNTNNMFVEWSKNNLKDHPCYKRIILSISNEELRIMHLLHLEYPCEIIAEMLGFAYDDEDMEYRIRTIKEKLLRAGMRNKEVNNLLAIEESNSKITIY